MYQNLLDYNKKKEELIVRFCKQINSKHSESFSLDKKSSNLFRTRASTKNVKLIDLKVFNKVIHVDTENLIADVEGLTTYEDLVHETLKYSCLPAVVPELKSITVGGAISGCGIESSSFRYGLVHETVKEMEILLADGRVVTCTPDNEYRDLFYGIPNSYGTFGYALRVKIQLIPVQKYVKLTHDRFSDPALYFKTINRLCEEKGLADAYIEGVIFDRNEMYITRGKFVDVAPYTSNYCYKNIYFKSIQTNQEDFVSTLDYIWRWDSDWFWCSKVFGLQNPLIRFLFGKFMLSSVVYKSIMHFFNRHPILYSALTPFQKKRESIIQDVLIPVEQSDSFLDFFQKEIGIKPIWICPSKAYSKKHRYSFCSLDPDTLYLDFGFWDSIETDKEAGYYNKKIEKKVMDLGGSKSLYSSSFYTEDEFWSIYNHPEYLSLKHKYDPKNMFGNLYEKCTRV